MDSYNSNDKPVTHLEDLGGLISTAIIGLLSTHEPPSRGLLKLFLAYPGAPGSLNPNALGSLSRAVLNRDYSTPDSWFRV